VAATPVVTTTAQRKDVDRPWAYQPSSPQTQIARWEPPTFAEVMKDLGLRVLEVMIAAVADAIGREIAYFFSKRRFYTSDQRVRKDW
jgi:hypothetical protein